MEHSVITHCPPYLAGLSLTAGGLALLCAQVLYCDLAEAYIKLRREIHEAFGSDQAVFPDHQRDDA